MVFDTRKITNSSATNQDNTVLLEVVLLARNVNGDIYAVTEAYPGNLALGRVWLLGLPDAVTEDDTPYLRTTLECPRLFLYVPFLPWLTH